MTSPPQEAAAQVELSNRNIAALASNMIDAGFDVVIEIVLPNRFQLDSITSTLTCDWLLIVLAPGIAVCRARNAARAEDQRWEFDGHEALEAEMLDSFRDIGWWLDTAHLGPAETTEQIISKAGSRM